MGSTFTPGESRQRSRGRARGRRRAVATEVSWEAGWGAGQGRLELTIEEAGLSFGMAFGVAIPSPPKLLSVEEVPEPGSGVQAVPAGQTVWGQISLSHDCRPHIAGISATSAALSQALCHHHFLFVLFFFSLM